MSALLAGGWRAATAQNPSDPCGQVTQQQVGTALGTTVRPGVKLNDRACQWSAVASARPFVTVTYSPPGNWAAWKTRQLPGVTRNAVGGVGDDAIAETVGNQTTLFVWKGKMIFMVRVYGVPESAKQLAVEKTLAKDVAAKI